MVNVEAYMVITGTHVDVANVVYSKNTFLSSVVPTGEATEELALGVNCMGQHFQKQNLTLSSFYPHSKTFCNAKQNAKSIS